MTSIQLLTDRPKGLFDVTNTALQDNVTQVKPLPPRLQQSNHQRVNAFTIRSHANDVITHLKEEETKYMVKSDYFVLQRSITREMRSVVVDWLSDMHFKAKLHSETLFLTIQIFDRFLATTAVLQQELQLCGICALLLASKYEELYPTEIQYLETITNGTYSKAQILAFEFKIWKALDFRLTSPSINTFLVHYSRLEPTRNSSTNLLASYYAQRSLQEFSLVSSMRPSLIASTCIYLARCGTRYSLRDQPWTSKLETATGYSKAFVSQHAAEVKQLFAVKTTFKAIDDKYSKRKYGKVSIMPLPELL